MSDGYRMGGAAVKAARNGIMGSGSWNYTPTTSTSNGTPTTPAANTVTPPAGFQTPSGFNVVSVGPTGIPTLRANGAANSTGSTSSPNFSWLSSLFGGGDNNSYRSRIASFLSR